MILAAETDADLAKKKATKAFINYLLSKEKYFKKLLKQDESDPPTYQNYLDFFEQEKCYICNVSM